jgi:D-amino-acid oxidase
MSDTSEGDIITLEARNLCGACGKSNTDKDTGCTECNAKIPFVTYPKLELSTANTRKKKLDKDSKHIIIIGGGVSGLTVAWMLLDMGFRVTILAKEWAWTKDYEKSRITSQIAGALWEYPPGGCGLTEIREPKKPGFAKLGHYQEWSLQSYEFYTKYEKLINKHEKNGGAIGLKIPYLYQFFYQNLEEGKNVSTEESTKLKAIEGESIQDLRKYKTPDDLKELFASIEIGQGFREQLKYAYRHKAPIVNTDKAMAYLMALVKNKGAVLETREIAGNFQDIGKDLLDDFGANAILNATGLGAKELVGDEDVYPVRGAVRRVENTRHSNFRRLNDAYLVPPQKDGNGHPTGVVFIVPRNDDILYVGSIIQPNNHDLKNLGEDSPEVQIMWDRANDFMPSLQRSRFIGEYPFAKGLRPFTKNNVKVRADEKVSFPLVHNYGHGGSGWTLAFGTARCALYILEKLLDKKTHQKKWAEDINSDLYGGGITPNGTQV